MGLYQEMWGCRTCNYDLCRTCNTNKSKPKNLVQHQN